MALGAWSFEFKKYNLIKYNQFKRNLVEYKLIVILSVSEESQKGFAQPHGLVGSLEKLARSLELGAFGLAGS